MQTGGVAAPSSALNFPFFNFHDSIINYFLTGNGLPQRRDEIGKARKAFQAIREQ